MGGREGVRDVIGWDVGGGQGGSRGGGRTISWEGGVEVSRMF